jgi:very-short-patch-repair endonuclease
MDLDLFAGVLRLAESQHGLVANWQLRQLGLTYQQVTRLSRRHGWQRVSTSVVRRAGSPRSPTQEALAAVLDAGPKAYLSFESACAHWGHRGCRLRPHHVLVLRTNTQRAFLGRVHFCRSMPQRWFTVLDGVPVVRPELLALQLFASMPVARATRLVDNLWARRLIHGPAIGELIESLSAPGRNGIVALRAYYEARGDLWTPPASGLESRLMHLAERAGVTLRRQVDVGNAHRWLGRVDFIHSSRPLIVEVQSELHHSALVDQQADAARIEALRAAGFVVETVWEHDLWSDAPSVVQQLRAGERRAGSPGAGGTSVVRG